MKNICLIGYMGSGKTTVGRLLAKELGFDFADTDEMIVSREGRRIPEIFEKDGEPYFRMLENVLIKDLLEKKLSDTVFSTGGGLPVREENRPLLKELGRVIYLKADAHTLYERVKEDKGRPLLDTDDKLKRIKEMLDIRGPIYEEAADLVIDTSEMDIDDVVKEIVNISKSS